MKTATWQLRIVDAVSVERTSIDQLVADLGHATGPVSYNYQFGADRRLFDLLVRASWQMPETLFAAATSRIALYDDEPCGIEIGFEGANFYSYKTNLATAAYPMVERGEIALEDLMSLGARTAQASYLNAHIPDNVYYIHALSVLPRFRGRRVGVRLMEAAIERACKGGFSEVQLDILSDNPAIDFYRAMGLCVVVETTSPILTGDHGFPSEFRMAISI